MTHSKTLPLETVFGPLLPNENLPTNQLSSILLIHPPSDAEYIQGKDGPKKYGMIKMKVKKGSTKEMVYMLSGPMKDNFVKVNFQGDLSPAKIPGKINDLQRSKFSIASRYSITLVYNQR